MVTIPPGTYKLDITCAQVFLWMRNCSVGQPTFAKKKYPQNKPIGVT